MDDFSTRIDAFVADALADRAAASGHTLDAEAATLRQKAKRLSVDEKLALSARQRAMAPHDCLSGDSMLVIRWFRDTNGGRDRNNGWHDADCL